ncbi:hypothetical protein [Pseudomonas agarici]|uniref:hypothetical protein n=1 Tax=Pseudomonas agarici TaxID=46677 RepID=UPI0015A455E3|nr:hypothetical protein [Pseudomonas agarici]
MLDDFLRCRSVRNKLEIIYTYATTTLLRHNFWCLQRPTGEIVPSIFEQKNIRFQRDFTLDEVGPERRIAYFEKAGCDPSHRYRNPPGGAALCSV